MRSEFNETLGFTTRREEMKNFIVVSAMAALVAGMTCTANAQSGIQSLLKSETNAGVSFSSIRPTQNSDLTFSSNEGPSSISGVAMAAASSSMVRPSKATEPRKQDRRGTSAADMLVGTGVAGSILVFRRKMAK